MIDILICFALVLTFFSCLLVNKYRKIPPGPYGLPIIGYYPYLVENPIETFNKLGKQYGDIMTMNMMGKTYWFLNSFEAIEEAFVTKGEIFSGRPSKDFGFLMIANENAIASNEGNEWKTQSRFVIKHLSKLGMGKSEFEVTIHNLLDDVERYIERTNGTPHDFHIVLSNFTFNTITALVASKHYDINTDFFNTFRITTAKIKSPMSGLNMILIGDLYMYWLKLKGIDVNSVRNNFGKICDSVQEIIDERLKTFDENNCQDLLDFWIKESFGPNAEFFQMKYISNNITSLLMGGTDSSAAIMYYCLYLMALHPNMQQKIFNEIDNQIGDEGSFCYLHRTRLPYTQAVLSEVQRFVVFNPFGVAHVNRVETTLGEYHVPKRTIVYANLAKLTRDKKYFVNPNEFDPKNFLDENGAYKPSKVLIPFGIGVRKCVGMRLAEVEMFLAFVRLMRKFEWTMENNETDSMRKTMEDAIRHLRPFEVCAKLRQ